MTKPLALWMKPTLDNLERVHTTQHQINTLHLFSSSLTLIPPGGQR